MIKFHRRTHQNLCSLSNKTDANVFVNKTLISNVFNLLKRVDNLVKIKSQTFNSSHEFTTSVSYCKILEDKIIINLA